jgi:outer membrane protein assembly factor BamA
MPLPYRLWFILLLVVSGISLISASAQTTLSHKSDTLPATDTTSFFDHVLDIFEFDINKAAVARNSQTYPSRLVLAPIISYAPETNWGLGVGAKFLFKFPKAGPETRTSNMPISAQYTLNNQFLLSSGYTIFFNKEKFLLKGNILYSKFPQQFYGIGNNTPEIDEELISYNMFLFEPLLLKRIIGKLFAGGGLRYNTIFNTKLETESQLLESKIPGYKGSRSAGVELAITYDSRNNVLNASKGMLTEFTHGRYSKWLGGTQVFQLTKIDIRQYFKLFRHRDDVLAFQVYGYFSSGDVPLIELGALGGNELMRGYYEGRYLDNNLLAAQIEYRLALTGRLGVVAFAGAGDVAHRLKDFRLSGLKPSFGLGLRFKIVKAENLNIRFDYGFGKGSNNYYFNVAEAF